ncbi:hypothetical protein JW979_06805 [bacterium]|nr:hypothetical protein [candidate division CSSED10-310 bacterium]
MKKVLWCILFMLGMLGVETVRGELSLTVEGGYGLIPWGTTNFAGADDYQLTDDSANTAGGCLRIGKKTKRGGESTLHFEYWKHSLDLTYDYQYKGPSYKGTTEADGSTYRIGWWYGNYSKNADINGHCLVYAGRDFRIYDSSVSEPDSHGQVELLEIETSDNTFGFEVGVGDYAGPVLFEWIGGAEVMRADIRLGDFEQDGVGGNGYTGFNIMAFLPLDKNSIYIKMNTYYLYNHSSMRIDNFKAYENTRNEIVSRIMIGFMI